MAGWLLCRGSLESAIFLTILYFTYEIIQYFVEGDSLVEDVREFLVGFFSIVLLCETLIYPASLG